MESFCLLFSVFQEKRGNLSGYDPSTHLKSLGQEVLPNFRIKSLNSIKEMVIHQDPFNTRLKI
jgi:hypothetical protein